MGVMDILLPLILLGGVYWLHSTGQLEPLLQGILPKPGAAPTPAPAPRLATPAPAPAPAPSGGGGRRGGGGERETTTSPAPSSGGTTISGGGTCGGGQNCGSSNGGSRNECDGVTLKEYEATWCGSFSGDDLSVKTFGPNHSGSSCCWCILSVSPDGAFGLRIESPHPSTTSKSKTTAAIGKCSCIKAVVRTGSGGINLEGWGFVNGAWKKAFTYQGPCGKSTTPASQQQVAFRCDGSLQTTCATVRPLGGGGGGAAPVPDAGENTDAPEPAGGGSGGSGGGEESAEESNYVRSYSAFRTRRRHYYA